MICTFGYLIGIIYGLYFKKSIAFILPVLYLIYIIYKLNINRYKILKYLKVIFNNNIIFLVIVSSLFSNTYLLYLNSKYNNFYKNPPTTIKTEAIVVRRCIRKRI